MCHFYLKENKVIRNFKLSVKYFIHKIIYTYNLVILYRREKNDLHNTFYYVSQTLELKSQEILLYYHVVMCNLLNTKEYTNKN